MASAERRHSSHLDAILHNPKDPARGPMFEFRTQFRRTRPQASSELGTLSAGATVTLLAHRFVVLSSRHNIRFGEAGGSLDICCSRGNGVLHVSLENPVTQEIGRASCRERVCNEV